MPLHSTRRMRRYAAAFRLQAGHALLPVALGLLPLTALRAQVAQESPPLRAPTSVRGPTLDSLTLSRLLTELQAAAISSSPDLASKRAQVEAARARAKATGFYQPLELSAGIGEAPNASVGQGNVRVEVGREVFAGRRLRAERGVADAEIKASEGALVGAERRMRLTVWRETIRAAALRLIAERLSAEDALLAGGEDGVRARFSVGQARYVDVLRLRTERLRVQSDRAATLADSRASVAVLRGLLGRSSTPVARREPADTRLVAMLDSLSTLELVDSWRTLLPQDAVTPAAVDGFLATASDVQLADAEVARARADSALAFAVRRPQVSALAGVQRIGQANNGPALGPSVGITISLPFTARRANQLGAMADAGRIVATESSRAAAIAAVRARIDAATERFLAARERLAVFDAALLRGARDERESALASYRSGGLSLLELVDFERALARAEIDRIRALVDAANAWAELSAGGEIAEEPSHTNSGSDMEARSYAR